MGKDDLAAQTALGWYVEAEAKYAYFMAGLATALTGYLGQNLQPVLALWSPATAEALAVGLFLLSALCGLKRLERIPQALRVQAVHFWHSDLVLELRDSARGEARSYFLGRPIPPPLAAKLAEKSEKLLKELDIDRARLERGAPRWAKARDYLLLAGLAALAISRIWAGNS